MVVVGSGGWRRPLILLPASTATELTTSQLRAVLAHELGHVRRRDDVANLVQVLADVTMFHHPAARWLSRQIRTEREYSCDDIAVAAADAAVYVRALAGIEDARSECRFAVAAASGTLLDRIQRILDQPRRTLTARRGVWICAIATAAAAGLASIAINIPPPSVPAGVRMRRPMPVGGELPAKAGELPAKAGELPAKAGSYKRSPPTDARPRSR
jgi:beta-lactamase regulating signal transducer with metallopeptidase domain